MKPPGVLTQAAPGIDSLEVRVKSFLKHRENKTGNMYLGIVHRLDRPASGVLVFGRNPRATRRLAEQFQGRLVRKTYLAVIEGYVASSEGSWLDYVRKIPDQARAEIVEPQHHKGKQAILHYRSCAREQGTTWLEIELETGRTHQVRVQAASRGHPILGDLQYGSTRDFGPACDDPRDRAIALHAWRLEFRHPISREKVSVTAPVPSFWPEKLYEQSLSTAARDTGRREGG